MTGFNFIAVKKALKCTYYFLLGTCIFLFTNIGYAQKFSKASKIGPFGNSQWYIGLQLGTNYTRVKSLATYTEFSRLNPANEAPLTKEYHSRFKNRGQQIGLKTAFSPYKSVNISLSGLYFTYQYGYQNQFAWQDTENPQNSLELTFDHEHDITYLEFPLVIRYYILSSQKIRPHLLGGVYYGLLLSAHKQVTESGIDKASGGTVAYQESPYATFITPLYISAHLGYLYGGGFTYRAGTLTLTLDVLHKKSFNQLTDAKNRYTQTRQLIGFGNVQDDLKLRNLEFSLSLLFPLKFLTKDFKPVVL